MYKFKRIIHLVPYDEPLIGKGTDSNAVVSSRVLDVAFRLATGKDMRFYLLVEHFLYLYQDILRGINGPETDNSKVFLPSAENGKRTGGTKHPPHLLRCFAGRRDTFFNHNPAFCRGFPLEIRGQSCDGFLSPPPPGRVEINGKSVFGDVRIRMYGPCLVCPRARDQFPIECRSKPPGTRKQTTWAAPLRLTDPSSGEKSCVNWLPVRMTGNGGTGKAEAQPRCCLGHRVGSVENQRPSLFHSRKLRDGFRQLYPVSRVDIRAVVSRPSQGSKGWLQLPFLRKTQGWPPGAGLPQLHPAMRFGP